MNKQELINELEESEYYFRVVINSSFEDFETMGEALKYIKKEWKKDSYYCSIRPIAFR